ncbi:MAG: UDP-N-acetylglucosamine diphosphorylase/glucosamine-1-phosphate N-acetyltransferase [bacterium]|nr:UDP-N-acetylglucosamine diphosphorylase/glucosamine-1-phosphate N-acetyltransferase [bacterium]
MSVAAARAPLTVLVLAAGKGTRLRSKTIKLLHHVAGRPMVAHVLDAVAGLKPSRTITVVGYQADEVRAALEGRCDDFVLQKEQRGTGHAVLAAARKIKAAGSGPLLIVNGDLPTLHTSTLRRFVAAHRRSKSVLSALTAELDSPAGYGRIVRDDRGEFLRIVEHADASTAERRIREINCGIYCADPTKLLSILRRLRPDNAQGEYYVTDAVHRLLKGGARVSATCHDDADEVLGVNTRAELAQAGATLYARKAEALQDAGVTILDASRTWVDPRARIGADTVLYPDVIVEGETVLGTGCVIRSGCRLVDARLGRNVELRDYSLVFESRLGNDTSVGPFAHVRPGSELQPGSRIGNFVEMKKARLGRGSKANHLTYLGDAEIGDGCNIGAGTITCNYDGKNKHRTTMGKGVFIGSNSQLVAPVKLGDRAYVAAGSTITQDVPAEALGVGRSRQRNIPDWARAKGKRKRKSRK